jgi:sensor histidine kinase regulating citrate/malate metabolism
MKNTKHTELSHLAREVCTESKLRHSDRTKLSIHFVDHSYNSCPVTVDRMGLKYALSNVLANAIEASPETGDIFIELKNQGWKCVLDVVDHGPGLEPKLMQKLMRFPLPAEIQELEGIGLFNASKLIRGAHGTMTFESRRNHGTRVRIELPLANQAQRQEA